MMLSRLSLAPLALFALLAFACIAHAETLYQWSPSAPHHASVVTVHAADGSAGSGVYVQWAESRFVLTAAHIVHNSKEATVRFPSGREASGIATCDRELHDCAAVLIGQVSEPAVSIAVQAPTSGQQIEICGYGGPRSQFRHFLCQPIAGSTANQLAADGRVTYGDSGGPWFVGDEVVGIQSTGAGSIGTVDTFDIFARCQSANTQCLQNFADRVFRRHCPDGQCPIQPAGPAGQQPPPQGISADDMYPPPAPSQPVPVPPLRQDPMPPIAAAPPAVPQIGGDGQTPHIDLDALRGEIRDAIVGRDIQRRSTPFGLTAIELALSAIGIGGGVSLPVWAVWMVARTVWRRKYDGPPSPSNAGTTGSEARRTEEAPQIVRETIPFPVSIDAPPTRQYRGVDQRYVTVETDRYAHAHAFAKEQLARRFPGAVGVLEAETSLIDQFLAGEAR